MGENGGGEIKMEIDPSYKGGLRWVIDVECQINNIGSHSMNGTN